MVPPAGLPAPRYPGLRLRGFDPAAAGQFEWILGPWLDESHGGGRRTVGWRAHPSDRPTDALAVLLNFEGFDLPVDLELGRPGVWVKLADIDRVDDLPPMAPTTRATRPPYTAPTAGWPATPFPAQAASLQMDGPAAPRSG